MFMRMTCLLYFFFFWGFDQMKLSMDEFRSLAARYADLYQSSFDADYATLRNVELYPLKVTAFRPSKFKQLMNTSKRMGHCDALQLQWTLQ